MNEKATPNDANKQDNEKNNEKAVQDTEETTEETTEATTESTEELEYLTTENQKVETTLYLSTPVQNATLNDIYSLLLSFRNLFIFFMLFLLIFKCKTLIHNSFAKVRGKEK